MGGHLNKEKVLSVLLFMLSLSFVVVPIIAAFSAHGWDPMATLLGDSNPIETQFGDLQNLNISENMFSVSAPTQGPNNTLIINAQFTSPLNFSIKIKDISGDGFSDGTRIGSVQLASEVEFPPNTTKNLSIICTPTQEGLNYIRDYVRLHGSLPQIQPKNARLSIDIYGIIVEGTFE